MKGLEWVFLSDTLVLTFQFQVDVHMLIVALKLTPFKICLQFYKEKFDYIYEMLNTMFHILYM